MIGAFRERLRDARRLKRHKSERERLMKAYGFAIQAAADEVPEAGEGRAAIRAGITAGSLAGFAALYEAARAADRMMANGVKLHVYLWKCLCETFGDDGAACDAMLVPFERWWNETRAPLAAAAYAMAAHATAFAYRGGRSADKVEDHQWKSFEARLDLGRDVLGKCLREGEGCTEWLWAHYDYGLHDTGSYDAFTSRFDQVWSRDRTNAPLCRSHGVRLLPRWKGRDSRDLETFARNAACATQDRFGDGMYAMIYGEGYRIGAHEIGDTIADKVLIRQGYDDLVQRFVAPSLLNRYATGMYFAGDYRTVSRIFRERLHVIVPETWLGDTRDKQVEDALETFRAVS